MEKVGDVDGVVVSHGSPIVSAEVMDGAPELKIVGELEGGQVCVPHRRGVGLGAGESAPWIRPTVRPIRLPNGRLA